ncbi:LPS translocon maturation chaperone LptM [Cellvibrio fontiphilus]|uniref:Lipoprotein n=1 Tax=Cellvibrio fontiphilus TaxID=1815559 RepID=A0ABV7FA31_9GAMM
MKKALVFPALILFFAAGLVACGQKGPLYLPQQQSKPQPPVESAPADTPEPAASATTTDPS